MSVRLVLQFTRLATHALVFAEPWIRLLVEVESPADNGHRLSWVVCLRKGRNRVGVIRRIQLSYQGSRVADAERYLDACLWWLNKEPFSLASLGVELEVHSYSGCLAHMPGWKLCKLTITNDTICPVPIDFNTICTSLEHLEELSVAGPTRASTGLAPPSLKSFGAYAMQFVVGCTAVPMTLNLLHLERLKACQRLRCIDISNTDVGDLSWLCWEALESLDVTGCNSLVTISELSNASALRCFRGGGLSHECSLGSLLTCSRLEVLDVGLWQDVHSCSPFASLASLRELTISSTSVTDLTPLAKCSQLTHLNARCCAHITALTPLIKLHELEHLDVSGTGVVDVRPLSTCQSLSSVSLARTAVSSVSALATMNSLTSLDISSTCVTSVAGLNRCRNLTAIVLDNCDQLTSLAGLAGAPALEYISAHQSGIRAVGELHRCPNLARLSVSLCTQLTDISPLSETPCLSVLMAWGTSICSLAGLQTCPLLATLDVSDCGKLRSPAILARAPSLTYLCATKSDIRDVTGLNLCPCLAELDVSECAQLKDISPLAGSTSLTVVIIFFFFFFFSDVSFLINMTKFFGKGFFTLSVRGLRSNMSRHAFLGSSRMNKLQNTTTLSNLANTLCGSAPLKRKTVPSAQLPVAINRVV